MLRAGQCAPNDLFSLRKDEKDIWNIKNAMKFSSESNIQFNILKNFS